MGFPKAGILEWVAISFCRGSCGPRDRTRVSRHCRQILYHSEPHGKIGERLDQLYLRGGWLDWLIWSLLQLLQWLQLHLLSMTTILSFSKSLSFQGASAVLCCRWGNGGGHTDRTTHSTCISRIGLKCWNQCFVIILLFQPSILQK